jgi:O-antigen/teichoic acid export membrane protein
VLELTLAVMIFLTLFVDFGSSPFGAREVAREPARLPALLSDIVRLRFSLATIAYALLAGALLLAVPPGPVRTLLLIYGLTLFAVPGFVQWVFQGHDKMQWVALGSMIRWTLFAAGVFVAVRGAEHLWRVGLVEAAAVLGFVAFNLYILKTRFPGARPARDRGSLGASFREALPIGLSELTWAATWYFATVLVGILLAGQQVGWFGAAHRPVMTLHTFVWLYFYNLLPSMARCTGAPLDALRGLVRGSLRVTAWTSLFGALVGTLFAEPIITLVFGAQYAPSVDVFRILVWMIPIALISGHYRYALIAYGLQKYEFYCALVGAVVSIGAGIPLVLTIGIRGAAAALVLSALVNLVLALVLATRKIGRLPFGGHLVQPLVTGGLMLGAFLLLRPINPWLGGAVGAAVYLALMLILQPEVRKLAGVLRAGVVLGLVAASLSCSPRSGAAEDAGARVVDGDERYELVTSSYLGGSHQDQVRDVVFDSEGNLYLTGGTASVEFPVTEGAFQTEHNPGTPDRGVKPYDVFVTKIAHDGRLVWSTRIGGPNYDRAYAIELDARGFVYVAGRAGDGFPVTEGAAQTKHSGGVGARFYGSQDGFVAKLTPDGGSLVWATFFGTKDPQIIRDLDVSDDGVVYVGAGYAEGKYPGPIARAFVNQRGGGRDAVVARLAADGRRIDWARFLGGSGREGMTPSVRVGPDGETMYVAAMTESADVPTTEGAFDREHNGGWDMYVLRLGAQDGDVRWATVLGGSRAEDSETHALAVDAEGNAVIAATTTSTDLPTTEGAFQPRYGGSGGRGTGGQSNYQGDIFVARLSADGRRLLGCTYVGGRFGEGGEGVALDAAGNVVVSGGSFSPDFPVTASAYGRESAGRADGVVFKLSADLTRLRWSTYIGGDNPDFARSVDVGPGGIVGIGGEAGSENWPLARAIQERRGGGSQEACYAVFAPVSD